MLTESSGLFNRFLRVKLVAVSPIAHTRKPSLVQNMRTFTTSLLVKMTAAKMGLNWSKKATGSQPKEATYAAITFKRPTTERQRKPKSQQVAFYSSLNVVPSLVKCLPAHFQPVNSCTLRRFSPRETPKPKQPPALKWQKVENATDLVSSEINQEHTKIGCY